MGAIASLITRLTIVYSTIYSDADQKKHQSSASLVFVWGIPRETGEFPSQMASYHSNTLSIFLLIWYANALKSNVYQGPMSQRLFVRNAYSIGIPLWCNKINTILPLLKYVRIMPPCTVTIFVLISWPTIALAVAYELGVKIRPWNEPPTGKGRHVSWVNMYCHNVSTSVQDTRYKKQDPGPRFHIGGLMQKRRNSIANTSFCIKPSKWKVSANSLRMPALTITHYSMKAWGKN